MAKEQRKYGVVLAENDAGLVKTLLRYLREDGAKFSPTRKGMTPLIEWDESKISDIADEIIGEFAQIAGDLDFRMFRDKRGAAEYVAQNAGSVDLVLMNRSNSHSPSDMDGFEATRYMREHGYEGHVALQSHFLMPEHEREAAAAGIDIFQKGGYLQSLAYIVQQYIAARQS